MSRMATCQGCEWGSQSMPPTTRVSPATEDTARHDGGEKTRVSTSTRVCNVSQILHPSTHPWTPPRPRLPTASLGPMAGGPPWLAPPSTWPLRGGAEVLGPRWWFCGAMHFLGVALKYLCTVLGGVVAALTHFLGVYRSSKLFLGALWQSYQFPGEVLVAPRHFGGSL